MFKFLKEKTVPSLAEIIKLDSTSFLNALTTGIESQEPGAWLMLIVALANLKPIDSRLKDEAKNNSNTALPATVDDSVLMWCSRIKSYRYNEIGLRRFSWFYLAALIMRANEIYEGNQQYENYLGRIWICLVQGCGLLPHALERNILWDADEKAWFSSVKNSRDGMRYCLNFIMPKSLNNSPTFREYAERENFSYWCNLWGEQT